MTLTEFLLARIAEDEAVADVPDFHANYIGHQTVAERLLAECEAKRRIVGIASIGVASVSKGRPHWSFLSGRVHDAAAVLAAMALPYSDHADYRQVWKP